MIELAPLAPQIWGEEKLKSPPNLGDLGGECVNPILKRVFYKDDSRIAPTIPIPLSPHPQSGLLLNNPHNPTGKLWTREEILPYLEQFSLVVIDEAFMDFLTPSQEQSLISLIEDYPNLVILRSLTKFYCLAWVENRLCDRPS